MTSEARMMYTILGVGVGIGYVAYLHSKINKMQDLVEVTVDKVADGINVPISDRLLESALDRAVAREVARATSQIARDTSVEIRTLVQQEIARVAKDIKQEVRAEITDKVKRVSISDIEQDVIREAKEAVAAKFDSKLDGILSDFNDELKNVRKIYSSIAKSVSND